jgi:HK97 family phage prohead protease
MTTQRSSVADTLIEQPGRLLGLPDMQTRGLQELTVRADDKGASTFEGWAVMWGVVDSYGTTFKRGSFIEGGLDQGEYALLWMHDPMRPIGAFAAEERDKGLWIEGGWDDTPEGQAARVRARRSAPGLSVGFVPIGVDPDDQDTFTSARLVETSQITLRMASVPGAAITASRISNEDAAARQLAADVALARLSLLDSPVKLG